MTSAAAMGPRIEDLDIREVWAALGGGPLRGNRGRAFWRNGDGYNVALDASRKVWYDHARHEHGGIVRLVEIAIGCDRRAALAWLGEHFGIETRERTPEERRRYAQTMEQARKLAERIARRRDAELKRVRDLERKALEDYHHLDRIAHERQDIELLVEAIRKWNEVEELTRLRDLLTGTDGPSLLRVFVELDREAA